METYEIVQVTLASGEDTWGVLALNEHGQPLGVDHHWLTRGFADHAMTLYQRGLVAHGELPDLVQHIYNQLVESTGVQP
jgi:hypothetical protein